MGLDISAIISNVQSAADQQVSDLWSTAGQSGIAFVEQQAINAIQGDQASHVATAQNTAQNILQRPTVAGSFGEFFGNIMQSPILSQYGPIVFAVAGAIILIMLM